MKRLCAGLVILIVATGVCNGQAGRSLQAQARSWTDHGVDRFQAGDYASAIYAFKRAIETYPQWEAAHYNLGVAYYVTGQYGLARQALVQALRLDPTDRDAQRTLALVYMAQKQFTSAAKVLRQVVAAEPGDAQWQLLLGRCLLAAGDGVGAVEPLQRAVLLRPTDPDARYSLAKAYLMTGRSLQAEIQLLTALQLRKGFEAAQRKLIAIYLGSGRYLSAHGLIKPLLQRHPDDKDLLAAYISVCEHLELHSELQKAQERLIARLPPAEAVQWRVKLADEYLAEGKAAQAIEHLVKALAQRPDDAVIKAKLARCYEQSGQLERAAKLWEGLARSGVRQAAYLIALGDLRYRQGRRAEALRAYEEALSQDRSMMQAVRGAVRAAEALGDNERAAYYVSVLVAENPQDLARRQHLVDLLVRDKQYGPALAQAQEIAYRTPGAMAMRIANIARRAGLVQLECRWLRSVEDMQAQLTLAERLASQGMQETSQAVYARLAADYGDDPAVRLSRARTWVKARRYAEAVKELSVLARTGHDTPQVKRLLAQCAAAHGNHVAAYLLLKSALSQDPAYVEAYDDLVGAAAACGKLQEAADVLTVALFDLHKEKAGQGVQVSACRALAKAVEQDHGAAEAARELAGIARLYRTEPVFTWEAATAYEHAGLYLAAADYFSALAGDPELAIAGCRRAARALLRAGRDTAAWKMAGRYVSLQPGESELVAALARLQAYGSEGDRGRSALWRLLEAEPGSSRFEVARVGIYKILNQLPQVAKLEQQRLAAHPSQDRYAVGAMTALMHQGEYGEVIALADRLPPAVAHRPEVVSITAQALAAEGRYKEALQLLATTPGLNTPSAALQIAHLCELDGRYEEALWEYSRALAGEQQASEAATALERLCKQGHVTGRNVLQTLGWVYRNNARQRGRVCQLVVKLEAILGAQSTRQWLAAHPPPAPADAADSSAGHPRLDNDTPLG